MFFFLTNQYTVCLVVFFFQAEDGIRDVAVTGVQTCALPISLSGGCTSKVAWLMPGATARNRSASCPDEIATSPVTVKSTSKVWRPTTSWCAFRRRGDRDN